jgi:hypothetical protein
LIGELFENGYLNRREIDHALTARELGWEYLGRIEGAGKQDREVDSEIYDMPLDEFMMTARSENRISAFCEHQWIYWREMERVEFCQKNDVE